VISRAKRALNEYIVTGVATTIPGHLAVLNHPAFVEATHHTQWMEEEVRLPDPQPLAGPTLPSDEEVARRDMVMEIGGRRFSVTYWTPELPAAAPGGVRRRPPKLERIGSGGPSDGAVIAPMQGTIVKVHVKAGDTVEIDQPICVLEAMKMENEVKSPAAGEVVDLRVRPGDTVAVGTIIANIK
jgi:acetyl-CoA/propionyl-CoA carboxylase biotin carboxyl carrier protein